MAKPIRVISLLLLITCVTTPAFAIAPVCSGANNWTASIASVHLKNAGITDDEKIDFTKTEITRLASEKIAHNVYQQVHHIIFFEKAGKKIEVITSNQVSSQECSMTDVDVFVVSQHLGEPAPKN